MDVSSSTRLPPPSPPPALPHARRPIPIEAWPRPPPRALPREREQPWQTHAPDSLPTPPPRPPLQLDTEIYVHSSLGRHENIISFLAAFDDARSTYLVLEYAEEGDVRKHLRDLDERRIRDFLVLPVLRGLHALHAKVR